MSLFHVIDDATVILRTKRGIFKQAKLYSRSHDGQSGVYAGVSGGFVRLYRDGTSCPDISWSDLQAPGRVDQIGIGNPKVVGRDQGDGRMLPRTPRIAGGTHEAHA